MENNFFIWEEKNSTGQSQNLKNNTVNGNGDTIKKTESGLIKKDSIGIIEKRRIYHRRYYDKNKSLFKQRYENNKKHYLQHCKKYRNKNSDVIKTKAKKYREENKNSLNKYFKEYYIKNRDSILKNKKIYHQKNKKKRNQYASLWYSKNSDYIRIYNQKNSHKRRAYQRKKRKEDIHYKLRLNLRSRLYHAIQGNYKIGSAVRDLGCTITQLKNFLESKFTDGMTWSNYGPFGWHIDHVRPLSSFDLTQREQFLKAFNFQNLQPMWAGDNLKKSDKYEF